MKLNSTTVNGLGMKGMAGYGPSAWNVGSAPITIASRASRNRIPAAVRSQREARSESSERPVAVSASIARRYAGTEPRVWAALDLVMGFLLIACPVMMKF